MNHLPKITGALRRAGFNVRFSISDKPTFTGYLNFKGRKVPIELIFRDNTIRHAPTVFLLEIPKEIPVNCAHLMPNSGYLCYMHSSFAYLDRSNLAGSVLGCLEQAEQLLEKLADEAVEANTPDEFLTYWKGTRVYTDATEFTPYTSYKATLYTVGDDFLVSKETHPKASQKYDFWQPKLLGEDILAYNIKCEKPLSAIEGLFPPKNLYELLQWLNKSNPKSSNGLRQAITLAKPSKNSAKHLICFFCGPNGWASVSIWLSKVTANGVGPQFMRSVLRDRTAKKITISRHNPSPVDTASWLKRNLPVIKQKTDKPGLAGKNIALLGCGSVGGYLIDLLVKSGAGFLGGKLYLSDQDSMAPGNIGRHYLGFPSVGKNKAEELSDRMKALYPDLDICIASDDEILTTKSSLKLDLVIDATGNIGLSQYLSEKVSRDAPYPVLYTWITGPGIGVQAFLQLDSTSPCITCLNYLHPGGDRSLVNSGYEVTPQNAMATCGDWSVPFSAGSAMHSAALAAELATDWASGVPGRTFRSITLNQQGRKIKPSTPKKINGCLACGQ